jgi:hypothetical protein
MKKMLLITLALLTLSCISGCGAGASVSETPSPGLPVVEVAPEDLGAKLAELSADAQSEPALIGYPIQPSYLADLNGDGIYELYANLCFGSGIVDERVQCYDPASDQTSTLSDRAVTDYTAEVYEQALYIIARPYNGGEAAVVYRAELSDGTLTCADIDVELQEAELEAQPD